MTVVLPRALELVRPDHPIVILTGAGISKESGLDTFRDADGVWQRYPLEDLATPEGFARNPALVHGFYNDRRNQLATAGPNPAHQALAKLELLWPAGVTLVTQNVDDLHEQGGSENVVHMHGELRKGRCAACNDVFEVRVDLSPEESCQACGTLGSLRPDIVWFGEMPYHMDLIFTRLADCRLFLSIGTSGNVYPAAGFVQQALAHGAYCLELNLEPSLTASAFDDRVYGLASAVVPAVVEMLLTRIPRA